MKEEFDFYDPKALKSYNLNESMRYQLNVLGTLDVFTRKHSENVANITCRLCEHLHLNTKFTIYCTMCAYLHDVGKQFIPSSVLQKPGKLTDEEYEIMKTHTTLGYKLCMQDPLLRPYAKGALYHHEALNGTGYPNGLTSKDIPIEGQIIRVADEFDAIVSKRQYKSHIGISDTLKILIENSNPPPKPAGIPSENKSGALQIIVKDAKLGKNNKRFVKELIKVVIEDTEYEISLVYDYIEHLEEEIKRLEQVDKYIDKINKTKSENKKAYYKEYINYTLKQGENIDNYSDVLKEYRNAYEVRKQHMDNLFNEVKKIKKLKV